MEFLLKRTGETITTHYKNPPRDPAIRPSQAWVIMKKLSEHPVLIPPKDVADGMDPPFTAGRYLCHRTGNQNELAYIRIYKQIPQTGTELDSASTRSAQASGPRGHIELIALKRLTDNGCTATPKLLGWRFEVQGLNDIVPGGYIIYFVWEKVEGDPLSAQKFWSLPSNQRELIRLSFRKAYSETLELGYQSVSPVPRHIIVDWTTFDVKISGFRQVAPVDTPEDREFHDDIFVAFQLALASTEPDQYLVNMATDIRRENHGWRW